MDWKEFYQVANHSFNGGECPSFFPLPRTTGTAVPPTDYTQALDGKPRLDDRWAVHASDHTASARPLDRACRAADD